MALLVPDKHKVKFATNYLATYMIWVQYVSIVLAASYTRTKIISLKLLPFSVGPGFPAGPLSTSLEYSYFFRKGQTRPILQGHRGEQKWEAATWLLEKSLTSLITEEHVYGPFPLCHLYSHHGNILVMRTTISLVSSTGVILRLCLLSGLPSWIHCPPAAPVPFKQAIIEFRDMFIEALER